MPASYNPGRSRICRDLGEQPATTFFFEVSSCEKSTSGGGWPAVWYTWRKAREAGGILKLWRAMRSKNACKTCALGMGGQRGGMVNELGHFPEVCKKIAAGDGRRHAGRHPQRLLAARIRSAQLQQFSPRELEACGRLVEPVALHARSGPYYTPISWDEALGRIVGKLRATPPDETFWYFSGRSSNEAGFLLQLFARLYGTNNVNNCSYYCHQASGVGLASVTGSGTATIELEDLEHADLVFVIGGNPASNHPRLMRTLLQRPPPRRAGDRHQPDRRNGPGATSTCRATCGACSSAAKIASLYVQPHIGGDLALLTGVAKRIVEMGAHDEAFLDRSLPRLAGAEGAAGEHRRGTRSSPRAASAADEIDEIAERYAAAKNVVFSWTMGITHHAHGVQNVQAIANLALLRGMVGRPGCGLMPIRGHSNVQGIGSVGVTPKLKDAIFERLQNALRRRAADDAGPRHDGLHRRRRGGRAESRLLPRRQSLRLQSRRHVRRPSARQPRSDRLSQHDAQHRPRPRPGARDDHPAGARPATKSRSRRRRNRCSTTSASATAARGGTRGRAERSGGDRDHRGGVSSAEWRCRSTGETMPITHPHPSGDRRNRARLRAARRHRPHEARIPNRRPHVSRAAVRHARRPRAAARARLAGRWPEGRAKSA